MTDDDKTDDKNRSNIMKHAATCLDFIRTVRWGTALSQYTLPDDRGLEVHVTIEVKCYSNTKDKKAP